MKITSLPESLIFLLIKSQLKKLERSDPDEMLRKSEQLALEAFKRASRSVPAYQDFLKAKGVDPTKIKTIEDFRNQVPVIDKTDTFIRYEGRLRELCVHGRFRDLSSILTSSGHSGHFSFGLEDRERVKLTGLFIDALMDYHIGLKGKAILLINCLPMGVKVPSYRMTVADVSVRPDMALSLIKNFGNDFDRIVLVGENLFVKSLLEEGLEKGFDLASYDLRVIVGEETFPEPYRTYLAHLLGREIDQSDELLIASSMGISEIGLMVFQETLQTIKFRRMLMNNAKLRKEFLGEDEILPMIFRYFPTFHHVEEVGTPEGRTSLVITSLDMKGILPLIRYNSGDRIRLVDHKSVQAIIPDYHHPSVFLYGRQGDVTSGGRGLSIEKIKEILYGQPEILSEVSGFFKIDRNFKSLKVQLNRYRGEVAKVRSELSDLFSGFGIEVEVFKYGEFPFPLDFERKWVYFA